MKRCRGEAGLTATQLAVMMPALLFWIMLIVQYGLWVHAKQVATAAAAEAVDVAQVPGNTPASAEAAARSFLTQSGNLVHVTVDVTPTAERITVRVRGQAPQLVPGFSWTVAAVAQAPMERYMPQPAR
ncbi:MAG: TadE/TadG family type IV pilus assembly protein [Acidimicrobiales bacterium]